jgi:hypothetical protein
MPLGWGRPHHHREQSEAIQPKPQPQSPSLDRFPPDLIRGLLAMMTETIQRESNML